jgi:thiol-disulfide isomerase/thioredoxin
MKSTIKIFSLAITVFMFIESKPQNSKRIGQLTTRVSQYKANLPAGQYSKSVPELFVGDEVPDIVIENVVNYGKSTVRISDFRGKLLIIDFWATWCSPCIDAFPKLDLLQKKFNNDIAILSISKEPGNTVNNMLYKLRERGIPATPVAFGDTILYKLFTHNVLPHYVWIGRDGVVKAFTGQKEINENNIRNMLDHETVELPIKNDYKLKLDYDKPIFSTNQLLDNSNLLFNSVLTKYIPGIYTRSSRRNNWIRCTSHSLCLLVKIAFGEFSLEFLNNNRLILEGFNGYDSLILGRHSPKTKSQWNSIKRDHLYNYELVVPDSTFNQGQLFKIMQQDINRFLVTKGMQAGIEQRNVTMLALVRTSSEDKLKTAGGVPKDAYSSLFLSLRNQPLFKFVTKLQSYITEEGAIPIEDETGYRGKVDLDINADLKNITQVNKELEKYDLKFVQKEKIISVIVISKRR